MSDLAKVGAVVIIVLALLIGVSQLVTGETLFRGKTYFVLVRFENGLGLRKGMPLKMAGTDVGWIEKIELTEPAAPPPDSAAPPIGAAGYEAPQPLQYTEAKIRVLDKVRLHENAIFIISQEGLIGEKYLSVQAGTGQSPLAKEGHLYYGRTAEDITRLISNASQVVTSVQRLLGPDALGGALTTVTESLNSSLQSVDALIVDAGGIIRGSQGYIDASLVNVEAMSGHLLALSQNLEDASVAVQTLARDPRYTETIQGVSADLEVVSDNLLHLSGQLDTLVSDPQVQQDTRDTVRLTKETLEEAKKTLQRFQETLGKADTVLEGAGGLIGETGGAISEARGKLDSLTSVGSRISTRVTADVRAVDRNRNEGLDNDDAYVGDINAAIGYDEAYVTVGADNIGEESDWNFMLGYGALDGFSLRGGVYRSELGIGAQYNLGGGGGVDVMLYDTEDPKLNAYGRIPVGDSVNVIVGVEDVENDPQATVGLGLELP